VIDEGIGLETISAYPSNNIISRRYVS